MLKAAVVMGSDSDLGVMKACLKTLGEFQIPYTVNIISAHRTPDRASEFASSARDAGYGVIIAAAGKAAHLAGVIAAYTTLPVIAVPISGKAFGGLDSLLSMVQMPPGVPVATVAVDGASNAAILAAQMLSLGDSELTEKLSVFKSRMEAGVIEKDEALARELENL